MTAILSVCVCRLGVSLYNSIASMPLSRFTRPILSAQLAGRERPFQGADDAPFEVKAPAFVVALEVVGDLSTLHRGAHDFPPLFAVGLGEPACFVQYRLQCFIRVGDEDGLPLLRVPRAIRSQPPTRPR